MFSKHRKTHADDQKAANPAPDDQAPTVDPKRPRLATCDHLGLTLVATLTVESLSGNEAVELTEELTLELNRPATPGKPRAKHVVLDLQNVEYMDSMCIGVLVEFLTNLGRQGGRIALVNAANNVEYLFKLTRLDRLFPICRDVMQAIQIVEREAA